jgi:ribosomal protein S18 acetylase RimI-like enzyme
MRCASWTSRNELAVDRARAVPSFHDAPWTWMEQPMKEAPRPIRLDISRRKQAAAMLTRAFQDDPLYRALLPEEDRRRKLLLWLHDKMLRYCFLYGIMHTLPSLEGTAWWLPPGQTEPTIGRILRSGLIGLPLRMGLATYVRFHAYMECSSELRRRNAPDTYWYLWVLGVDPSFQGQGVGGRLIRPVLEQADASGIVCYLETEAERNLAFYERHGFRIMGEARVPGLDVRTWSLLREPLRGG